MSIAAAAPELFAQGLTFGFVNSLHCAAMCGPMAAFFLAAPRAAIGYHAARTFGYIAAGALAGGVGVAFGSGDWGMGGAMVAFVLAAALLAIAGGLERHLGRIPGTGRFVASIVGRTRSWSPAWRAAAIGMLTPLLPCGLLYGAYSAALVAGSPLAGAASMAGFALGLLPVLAVTQANLGWIERRFGRRRLRWIARVTMVIAAAMLVWRGLLAVDAAASGVEAACPLCEPE